MAEVLHSIKDAIKSLGPDMERTDNLFEVTKHYRGKKDLPSGDVENLEQRASIERGYSYLSRALGVTLIAHGATRREPTVWNLMEVGVGAVFLGIGDHFSQEAKKSEPHQKESPFLTVMSRL